MNSRKTRITDLDLNLFIKIAQYLSLVEIAGLLILSKPIHNILMRDGFWQGRFRVANYTVFAKTLPRLQDPDLIDTFCNGFMSPENAIETQRLLDLSADEREAYFIPANINTHHSRVLRSLIETNRTIIALNEGLLTIDQLISHREHCIEILSSDLGLSYFRKKLPLLTTPFVTGAAIINRYDLVMTPNGLCALEENLLTIDQIRSFCIDRLRALLSDEGINALRNQLFTPEEFSTYALSLSHTNISLFWNPTLSIQTYIERKRVEHNRQQPPAPTMSSGLANKSPINKPAFM